MNKDNRTPLTPLELIEYIIEKQRIELVRIVEKHQFDFQNNEVIAASTEMDQWLNVYLRSIKQDAMDNNSSESNNY